MHVGSSFIKPNSWTLFASLHDGLASFVAYSLLGCLCHRNVCVCACMCLKAFNFIRINFILWINFILNRFLPLCTWALYDMLPCETDKMDKMPVFLIRRKLSGFKTKTLTFIHIVYVLHISQKRLIFYANYVSH